MIKIDKLLSKINDFYTSKQSLRFSYETHIENKLFSNENYLNLENSIKKLDYEIAKAEYENNFELSNKLEEKKSKLLTEKTKLYNEIILDKKYVYNCPICKDTGIYKNKRCKCYYKLLTKFTLESLNVKERNFATFDCEVPKSLTKHYKTLKLYSEKFPYTQINNFVFLGKVGTGKTYLSTCVASELIKKNMLPIFLTATELNSIFLKMHKQEVDRELVFDILTTCDLLIIDDLGTEPLYNNVTSEYLLAIISERLDKNKHFIITTNLSTSEILSRYNERFLSRISNKKQTAIIPFNDEDLRK